jgi:hypothetical protein
MKEIRMHKTSGQQILGAGLGYQSKNGFIIEAGVDVMGGKKVTNEDSWTNSHYEIWDEIGGKQDGERETHDESTPRVASEPIYEDIYHPLPRVEMSYQVNGNFNLTIFAKDYNPLDNNLLDSRGLSFKIGF